MINLRCICQSLLITDIARFFSEKFSNIIFNIKQCSSNTVCKQTKFRPCVVLAITAYSSCVRLFDVCLKTLPKSRSRLLSILSWITATRTSAQQIVYWAACSQFKMPWQVSLPETGGMSTSHQCYVSCTGCQSTDEWISSYPPLSIVRWLAPLLCT